MTTEQEALREALLDHYPAGLWKQQCGDWAGTCRCGFSFIGRISSEAQSVWADHVIAGLQSANEGAGVGWIVANGRGDLWRTWKDGWSSWTAVREHATRYARREDAEAVHREDEEAWLVQPYAAPDSLGSHFGIGDHPKPEATGKTIRIAVAQASCGHLTIVGPDDFKTSEFNGAMDAAMSWSIEAGYIPTSRYWLTANIPEPLSDVPEIAAMAHPEAVEGEG